jgi:transposase-like protein
MSYYRFTKKSKKNMTKSKKTLFRYSICFKEKVVQEVSSGSSISEVCRRYGIRGGSTVQRWLKEFGREDLFSTVVRVQTRDEIDELKRLKTENTRLKIAIADMVISQQRTEVLIASINTYYQIDARAQFAENEENEAPASASKEKGKKQEKSRKRKKIE